MVGVDEGRVGEAELDSGFTVDDDEDDDRGGERAQAVPEFGVTRACAANQNALVKNSRAFGKGSPLGSLGLSAPTVAPTTERRPACRRERPFHHPANVAKGLVSKVSDLGTASRRHPQPPQESDKVSRTNCSDGQVDRWIQRIDTIMRGYEPTTCGFVPGKGGVDEN